MRISEQELAHLRELAIEITQDAEFTPEFLASFGERSDGNESIPEQCPQQNVSALKAKQAMVHTWRSIFLCKEIKKQLNEKAALTPEQFFNDPEELNEHAINRIIYQRNSYADEAYLCFSKLLTSPRSDYAKSFGEACESVYNRECEYCILPIESSFDGQLTSFWRLIARYGLKLTAICDVSVAKQNQTTRFALLRATPIAPLDTHRENLFFSCTIPYAQKNDTASLLYAAQCCGLTLFKIHSEDPFFATDEAGAVRLTFRADEGDLTAFLLYLFLEHPTHTLIGFYPHLEH